MPRQAAKADARFAARLAAKELGNGVELLRQTVAGAAANPGIAKAYASPEDCGLSFGGTDAYTTGHLDLVRADGRVACSSLEQATARDYAQAPWREQALTQAPPARAGRRSPHRRAGGAGHGAGAEGSGTCWRRSTSTASARA